MDMKPIKKPWQLIASDFSMPKIYADQDWRFQMFFEYLRISPSFALANELKNEQALASTLGDSDWAARVWKTYSDIGNVYGVMYRDWWLSNGLRLFGIHTAKPKTQVVTKLKHSEKNIGQTVKSIDDYLSGNFERQGQPDSILVSIPLGQKRVTIMKQLRKLLDDANQESIYQPKALYPLEVNKMRYRRLLAGLRLVYMQAARPDEALWRVATRAKISEKHTELDPNAKKKTVKDSDPRRILTIMASRLMRDTLIIAENAAQGQFPTMNPSSVKTFDFEALQKMIYENNLWEKTIKGQLK
jgi:hypothetical protein